MTVFLTKPEAIAAINRTPKGVLFAVDIRNETGHPTSEGSLTSAIRLRISREQAISVVRNYMKKSHFNSGFRIPVAIEKTPDDQDIIVIGVKE